MPLEFHPGGGGGQILLAQPQRGLSLMAHEIDTAELMAELAAQGGDPIEVGAGQEPLEQLGVGLGFGKEGFQLGIGHGVQQVGGEEMDWPGGTLL